MKKITQLSFVFIASISMTSCGGWTEKGEQQFHEECDKMKVERAQCDCMMEKAKVKFSSFDDIKDDQPAMAEIFLSEDCLEKAELKTEVSQ